MFYEDERYAREQYDERDRYGRFGPSIVPQDSYYG
jgi:hypothetical protein